MDILMYEGDHPWRKFTLWDVYNAVELKERIYLLECETAAVRRGGLRRSIASDEKAFYEFSDYEFAKEIRPDVAAGVALVWDKPVNHGTFSHVLFADGHIEKVPVEKLKEVIGKPIDGSD